jgi:hypothetical protein
MAEDMQSNPDYQLVMTFLRNITPGDMSPEAANQLIAIGQRIQGGGVLSDREREMFEAVVGNISQKIPEQQMSYDVDGQTVPMTQERYGTEMQSGNITPDLPSADGETYGPSSGVTVDSNVLDMQQMIDAGIINPQRPPMRPSAAPMTSPPPPMRPKNLGGR